MSTINDFAKWLESLAAAGDEYIEGADTFEPPWRANLAVILKKAQEAASLVFPENATEADRDRIILRAALERGRLRLPFGTDETMHASGMLSRGLLTAFDRLGMDLELTPLGHRHLAGPDYDPPGGLYMADRFHDPEALVCQASALLRGVLGIERLPDRPGEGFEGRTVSPEAKACIIEEAKRLAG